MDNNIRLELIKQFPAEAIKIEDRIGSNFYACPTCKRPVTPDMLKCTSCGQLLKWSDKEMADVKKTIKASVSFDVPIDFVKGNCRKCPIAKVRRNSFENNYECPLGVSSNCPVEFKNQ